MKFKNLSKLVAGIMIASSLLVPVTAQAATAAPTTYTADTAVTNQTVKLDSISFYDTAYSHGGASWSTVFGYDAYIIVENKTYSKHIVLHYKDASSTSWQDSNDATYQGTRADGKEIWAIHGYFYDNSEFCVYYKEVNAWDNNNNQNYKI